MYRLEVEQITKRYGGETVVDDLSFTVEPGRVTGFLGPNGAGKSTTLKILLDLSSADHGQTRVGGSRYRDLDDPGGTVGVFLEANAFHPGRSGRGHLRILAEASGISFSRVDELLDQVGLGQAADRHVGAYSLGMRQRLGLAGALLGDPPVLVLDEPGNGLDPQGIHNLRDLLRSCAAQGNTVFVSSHLLAEVEHLADDVVVINHGQLVAAGPLARFQEAGTLVRTPEAGQLTGRLESLGARVQPGEDGALLVRNLEIAEIGECARSAGIALHELSRQTGSLESLFLSWTGQSEQPALSTPHAASSSVDKKEVSRR